MSISAKEAADLVGMTKQGIIKAIRSGKISAEKNIHGTWEIQAVELFRVYPPISTAVNSEGEQPTNVDTNSTPVQDDSLRVENEQLRQRLADKDDVIADLRQRLDAEAEERRKLTHILTDKQQQPATTRTSWWQRLFGGGA